MRRRWPGRTGGSSCPATAAAAAALQSQSHTRATVSNGRSCGLDQRCMPGGSIPCMQCCMLKQRQCDL